MRVGAARHRAALLLVGPAAWICQWPTRGLCSQAPMTAPRRPLLSTLLRSRHLEEEQQAALTALSEQLKAITSVEELTKLVSDCVPGQTIC